MRDDVVKTAMMKSDDDGKVASFLSPFEAGLIDNSERNQTCYAIDARADVIMAIRLEKTAGWLREGKTILEARMICSSVSEKDKQKLQHNPLWMREIELAETQQKRRKERHNAERQMHEEFEEFEEQEDPFDEENNEPVSSAFQWLPRGIRFESAFNRFIARETR